MDFPLPFTPHVFNEVQVQRLIWPLQIMILWSINHGFWCVLEVIVLLEDPLRFSQFTPPLPFHTLSIMLLLTTWTRPSLPFYALSITLLLTTWTQYDELNQATGCSNFPDCIFLPIQKTVDRDCLQNRQTFSSTGLQAQSLDEWLRLCRAMSMSRCKVKMDQLCELLDFIR